MKFAWELEQQTVRVHLVDFYPSGAGPARPDCWSLIRLLDLHRVLWHYVLVLIGFDIICWVEVD